MKRRVLLLALVLAVSACDEKKTAPAAPKASAATVAAPAASSAAPPEKKLPWFVGHFSGAYDAQHYLIEMSKSDGVVRNWAEDDGGAGSGEGTISLDVTEDGTIVGSSKGPLGELVASIVEEQRPLFEQANLDLSLSIEPALPLALLDELRATQIVVNLLSNARKYTPGGGTVQVALGCSADLSELRLAVSDTGVGIAPEDQPEIGTWLFRAKSAKEISAKGVGLGLYITRSLVELHGGRFWFESTPGAGSVFHVTFLAADGS